MGEQRKDVDADGEISATESAPEGSPEIAASGPPPKPRMSDRTPAPIHSIPPPPGSLKAARRLLSVSCLIAIILAVVIFLNRETHGDRLLAYVTDRDPGQSTENLKTVAAILFWSSLSALVAVVLVQFIVLNALMRQHASARWFLVLLLILHAGAILLAVEFLVPTGTEGLYTLLALGAQIPIAGLGLILAFSPAVGTWLHSRS
ncbi:hypothetical protein [Arthrobacter sp. B1805]|uniref:hypothetical protein n=1 Tax=Arthrobacter sp. B1805 TaxID=2058892 RepID=UPI000CE2C95E|nr:hypothetical protein [Arthrobacter sp. B1805]